MAIAGFKILEPSNRFYYFCWLTLPIKLDKYFHRHLQKQGFDHSSSSKENTAGMKGWPTMAS